MKKAFFSLFIIFIQPAQAQVVQWVCNGGGVSFDAGYSVCNDAAGNSYVAGRYMGPANFSGVPLSSFGLQDGFMSKYDPAGNLLWAEHIGGVGMDYANSISADNFGNIIIGGQFSGNASFGAFSLSSVAGSSDCFVAKYDASGICLWAISGGSSGGYDNIREVTTDAAGNIFVTGWLSNNGTFAGYTAPSTGIAVTFAAEIDPSGSVQWVTPLCQHNSGSMPMYGHTISVDGSGSVFVAGNFSGACNINGSPITAAGLQDIFLQMLDPNGSIAWSTIISGPDDDAAFGVACAGGRVFITGNCIGTVNFSGLYKSSTAGSRDIFLACYSFNGVPSWVNLYGSANNENAGSVIVLPGNNLAISGTYSNSTQLGSFPLTSNGGTDGFVAYLSPSGIQQWAIHMGGTGSDQAWRLSTDGSALFCTGIFTNAANFNGIFLNGNGSLDAFLVKIDPGVLLPVELISFQASVNEQNTEVLCTWSVASEKNSDYYLLEKGDNGSVYEKLISIPCVAENGAASYRFTDHQPLQGISYYRLSQADRDGKITILKTVAVSLHSEIDNDIQCNPSSEQGYFSVSSCRLINRIIVTDCQGQEVKNSGPCNARTAIIDLRNCTSGIYFIVIISGDQSFCKKIAIHQ